jgi:hypothetical protein
MPYSNQSRDSPNVASLQLRFCACPSTSGSPCTRRSTR